MPGAREPREWRCGSCMLRILWRTKECALCRTLRPEASGAPVPSAAGGTVGGGACAPSNSPLPLGVQSNSGSTQAASRGGAAGTPRPIAASTSRSTDPLPSTFGGGNGGGATFGRSSSPVVSSLPSVAQRAAAAASLPPSAQPYAYGATASRAGVGSINPYLGLPPHGRRYGALGAFHQHDLFDFSAQRPTISYGYGATTADPYGYGAPRANPYGPAAPFTSGTAVPPQPATVPRALGMGSDWAASGHAYTPCANPYSSVWNGGRGAGAASAYPAQTRGGGDGVGYSGVRARGAQPGGPNPYSSMRNGGGRAGAASAYPAQTRGGGDGVGCSGVRARGAQPGGPGWELGPGGGSDGRDRKVRRTVRDGSRGAGSGGGGSGGGGGGGSGVGRYDGGGAEGAPTRSSAAPNAEHVVRLIGMGYPEGRARATLRDAGGNLQQAVDILLKQNTQGGSFSNPVDISCDSATSNTAPAAAEPECKVCMERPVNCTLVPCGHHCCCTECAAKFRLCPICRAHVQQKIKTFGA